MLRLLLSVPTWLAGWLAGWLLAGWLALGWLLAGWLADCESPGAGERESGPERAGQSGARAVRAARAGPERGQSGSGPERELLWECYGHRITVLHHCTLPVPPVIDSRHFNPFIAKKHSTSGLGVWGPVVPLPLGVWGEIFDFR